MAAAAQNYAAGVKASNPNQAWQHFTAAAGTAVAWPYNANVVWQDTTSNATYCSVSSALGV